MSDELNDYLNQMLSEDAMAAIKTTKQVIFIKHPEEKQKLEDKSYKIINQLINQAELSPVLKNLLLEMANKLENLENQVEENDKKLSKMTEMFDETQKKINNLESIIENIKRNQATLFDIKEKVLEVLDTETIPF